MTLFDTLKRKSIRFADEQFLDLKDNLYNHIRDSYGKVFLFDCKDDYIISIVTEKFLKKHDKRFEQHVTEINRKKLYINRRVMIPLHIGDTLNIPDTGIYLTSGKYVDRADTEYGIKDNYLQLYIFGKHCKKYIKELKDLINNEFNSEELGLYTVTVCDDNTNIVYSPMQPREFSTLYFSNGEITKIKKFLNHFCELKEFYQKKQLLYKTGILLYGKPGTGKTSLVKAIANYYGRSVINIKISDFSKLDIENITQAINVDTCKYIVLLEDIDTLFLNRESDINREEAGIVNKLLQFLDSNTSPQDVIFIATTNHIDRLDEALLRNGRFDLKVEIKEINEDEVYKFGEDFGVSSKDITYIIDEYIKAKEGEKEGFTGTFNQSSIQSYLLNKLDNKERSTDIIDTAEVIAEELEKKYTVKE